jgi:hypothetical protein
MSTLFLIIMNFILLLIIMYRLDLIMDQLRIPRLRIINGRLRKAQPLDR